jgi:hypothetical protein
MICLPQPGGVKQTRLQVLPRRFSKEGRMDSRAPETMSSAVSQSTGTKSHPHEGRNFWVLTAYGISGLALFGILAYYFSDFVSH